MLFRFSLTRKDFLSHQLKEKSAKGSSVYNMSERLSHCHNINVTINR